MHKNSPGALFSVKTDPFVEMQRSGIPVETNSCECGLKRFVRSWIKGFLWKLLCIEMQTKWIYVHLALPVWLWDMWGHFLQKRRENHFFIVPHWKGTLIKHKHNFHVEIWNWKKKPPAGSSMEDVQVVTSDIWPTLFWLPDQFVDQTFLEAKFAISFNG